MTLFGRRRAAFPAIALSFAAFAAAPLAVLAQDDEAVGASEAAIDVAAEARAAAEDLIASLTSVGADETLDDSMRRQQIREILSAHLATGPMSRFALGASRRAQATDAQAARFEELFPDYIAVIFGVHVQRLAERPLDVRDAVLIRDNEAMVQSFVFDDENREAAQIDWRYRISEDDALLLDVVVEGISRMVALRAEFGELIDDGGGIEALLSHMDDVIAGVEEARAGQDLQVTQE